MICLKRYIVAFVAVSVLVIGTGCRKLEVNEAETESLQEVSVETIKTEEPEEKPDLTESKEESEIPIKKVPVEVKGEEEKGQKDDTENQKAKDNDEKSLEDNSVCTMVVSCKQILENMDALTPEKKGLVPEDGIIFSAGKIVFEEGESIFDVLKREMKNNNIHLEFSITTGFNTAYVEGINNLYEFDCGDMSGWTYKVNGEIPGVGSSQYMLKNGDSVEWIYYCGSDR